MFLRSLLMFLFMMMSVVLTGAQQGEKMPDKFRVSVEVDGKNLSLTTEAESYLKRELRSLGDVEVKDLGIYELHVIFLESTYKSSGTKTGKINCTYLGLKRFNPFDLADKLPREHFDTVFDATSNLYYFPEKWMLRTNEERTELKQVCQQIVAEFDTRLLEPDRQKR